MTILPLFLRLPLLRASLTSDESGSKIMFSSRIFYMLLLSNYFNWKSVRKEALGWRSFRSDPAWPLKVTQPASHAGAGHPHAPADAQDNGLSTCAGVFSQLFRLPWSKATTQQEVSLWYSCRPSRGIAWAARGGALLPVAGRAVQALLPAHHVTSRLPGPTDSSERTSLILEKEDENRENQYIKKKKLFFSIYSTIHAQLCLF